MIYWIWIETVGPVNIQGFDDFTGNSRNRTVVLKKAGAH